MYVYVCRTMPKSSSNPSIDRINQSDPANPQINAGGGRADPRHLHHDDLRLLPARGGELRGRGHSLRAGRGAWCGEWDWHDRKRERNGSELERWILGRKWD